MAHAFRFAPDLAEAVQEAKAAVRMDDDTSFKVLKDVARTELVKMINAARNKGKGPSLPSPHRLAVSALGTCSGTFYWYGVVFQVVFQRELV